MSPARLKSFVIRRICFLQLMLALRKLQKKLQFNRNGKSKICESVGDETVFKGAFHVHSESTQVLNKFSKVSITVILTK